MGNVLGAKRLVTFNTYPGFIGSLDLPIWKQLYISRTGIRAWGPKPDRHSQQLTNFNHSEDAASVHAVIVFYFETLLDAK